jgi:hypothetical protein
LGERLLRGLSLGLRSGKILRSSLGRPLGGGLRAILRSLLRGTISWHDLRRRLAGLSRSLCELRGSLLRCLL